MSDRSLRSDQKFGFAPKTEDMRPTGEAAVRLVYSDDHGRQPRPLTGGGMMRSTNARPAKAIPASADGRWVIKPKTVPAVKRPVEQSVETAKPSATRRRKPNPDAVVTGEPSSQPEGGSRDGSRRWFAIGLAGMAYVIGIAGLWSMVQSFQGPGDPALTPAGGATSLPPIEETIDVRDARLDGPFIPKFKPDSLPVTGDDVAVTDLQKQS